jgi:hypothetical protein
LGGGSRGFDAEDPLQDALLLDFKLVGRLAKLRFAFFYDWQREVRIGAIRGFNHKILREVSVALICVFLPDPRIIE